MSRHDVPARAPDLAVVVGWDGPLQTFFAQVHRQIPGAGQSKIILWVGMQQREIADAAQLAALLAPFAELTDHQLIQLGADEAASLPPTPVQLMMGRLTRRSASILPTAAAAGTTRSASASSLWARSTTCRKARSSVTASAAARPAGRPGSSKPS